LSASLADNAGGWFSESVSLLPFLFAGCLTASFSRASWWASISGPFLCSPESKNFGLRLIPIAGDAAWERNCIVEI
jgi:hypothetical protein